MANQETSKHTPGPWSYTGRAVNAKNGELSIGVVTPRLAEEANARLIAAAPDLLAERDRLREINADLLAALKEILDAEVDIDIPKFNAAREAIAKAEGR